MIYYFLLQPYHNKNIFRNAKLKYYFRQQPFYLIA